MRPTSDTPRDNVRRDYTGGTTNHFLPEDAPERIVGVIAAFLVANA
jgi:hypothetical protein